ncbi:MAG TPA: ATP-binding cassette domain-containing protein [Myxococcales bacterium]|nr:ATP-binding cassette domain-containing protein [Myxococcales bacterium]
MRAPPWLRTYLRLWRLLVRGRRGQLVLALAAMGVGAAATGGFAALTGPALRMVFSGGPAPAWLHGGLAGWLNHVSAAELRALLPAAIFALAVLRAGCAFVQADRMGALTLRAVAELQEELHARILRLPLSYFQGRHTGELFSRFGNDLGEVERALGQALASSVRDGLQIVALVTVSALLDARLLALAALAVPATVWPISRFARALRGVSEASQLAQAKQVASAQEAIAGVAVLHAYGAQEAAMRAYGRGEARLLDVQRRSALLRAAFSPTIELVGVVAFALVLFAVGAAPTALPPDKLLSFLGAVLFTYQPLKSLANGSQWLVPGLTAAERIFALIDAPPAIADRPSARTLARVQGRLRFENVTVRYGEKTALDGLELDVRPGEKLGIVGPSGAGKTTLLHLVPRLLDPDSGRVCVDDLDVREATLASLRRQVALVAQDVFLFDASVADNVAAAAPGASTERIEAALEAAGALAFVRALPQGLETRLGERGAMLSGGQRQRLAIARALLKDAPVLLLDEATSALDAATEGEVQRALAVLMAHRTVLVVAHRLSTVRDSDRLIVLEGGRLVEQGTHAQLWGAGGLYRRLCDLQGGAAAAGNADV